MNDIIDVPVQKSECEQKPTDHKQNELPIKLQAKITET